MFAGFRKLDNLVVVVDNNGLQIDGKVDEVCSPYPIDKKFEAFNFHVINVADGNDMDQLKAAFDEAKTVKGMPIAIIMKTVKGKGVSFMENKSGRNTHHVALCDTTVNMSFRKFFFEHSCLSSCSKVSVQNNQIFMFFSKLYQSCAIAGSCSDFLYF